MRHKNSNGYTLTEILLVVGIISLMASLIIPRLFPQAERARVSEAVGILGAARQGEEAFFLENTGIYLAITTTGTTAPENAAWAQIGMANPNANVNRYFDYIVNIAGPTFRVRAQRNAILSNAQNPVAGNIIAIDNTGSYCGNHLDTPRNAGALAGPCPAFH